jgi:hypothetical protein
MCGELSQEGAFGGNVVDLLNFRDTRPIINILFAPVPVVVQADVLEGRCLGT